MVRIGIDVGGTFTHAVAIDNDTYELVAHAVVPTTHQAKEGVARGIVEALQKLLGEARIDPASVAFIAHSTTQATNALLEGDVASVGILAMGYGVEGYKARADTRVENLDLGGRLLDIAHVYVEVKPGSAALMPATAEMIDRALEQLGGKAVIVAAEPFSVDDPGNERFAMERATLKGVAATGTHEISKLYGLKVRTRTAVINASILPKMMESALMTAGAVADAGIGAPLMIMRGDGGVMNVAEVRKRPILTLLSGPAAGVAGALMFERVTDGIFLEVGGTSTDISAVKNGRVIVRHAEVGGHKTYLRSLDTRTLGIAGGSMIRVKGRSVESVGPRSAHIAGLPYSVFADPRDLRGAEPVMIQPRPGDPADYVAVRTAAGETFALTLTCAANLAGVVERGDYAAGNGEAARIAFEALARYVERPVEDVVRNVMDVAAGKVEPTVNSLIEEYGLDRRLVTLVGGGGGCSAVVPYLASRMGLQYRRARQAEVISAIGVGLALVRDMVERTIVNPTEEDIIRIRREAEESVLRLGAAPGTVEVEVEVDASRNLVRAVACGASEMRSQELARPRLCVDQMLGIAAESMRLDPPAIAVAASTSGLAVFQGSVQEKRWMGLSRRTLRPIRIVDYTGVIRLQKSNGIVVGTTVGSTLQAIENVVDSHTAFGDGGQQMPEVYLIYGARIANLSGLASVGHMQALARTEIEGLPLEDPIALVLVPVS
ncbi:MAG: hydantoinase/oxoprolinase family protein [Firmicutes bacterium]|nr:hydantoinase/oxoprolinase family protein [Bacillota bacterium]